MRCIAIILSGGTGNRMNMDIPKQYIKVSDHMIITESIRPFMECPFVNEIQVVADEMWQEKILEESKAITKLRKEKYDGVSEKKNVEAGQCKLHGFSAPGANRQLSILNALRDIQDVYNPDDIVIIHDAARPLVSMNLIQDCINGISGHDGVMPVLPMKDTVYYSEDAGRVTSLLNRDKVFAGQAPEVFRIGKYLAACEKLLPDRIMNIRGSTEPAIMDGMDIAIIPGDERNFKITTREDLERYRRIVSRKR